MTAPFSLLPIEERNAFNVKAVGEVMVSFHEDGKTVYQLFRADWLLKVEPNKEKQGGDASDPDSQ